MKNKTLLLIGLAIYVFGILYWMNKGFLLSAAASWPWALDKLEGKQFPGQ